MLQIDVTQSCVMQLWNVLHRSASLSCEANIQLCDLSQMQLCGVPHIGLVVPFGVLHMDVTLWCATHRSEMQLWCATHMSHMQPCGVLHIDCTLWCVTHRCYPVVCYSQVTDATVWYATHRWYTWCVTHRCYPVVCYIEMEHWDMLNTLCVPQSLMPTSC